MGTWDIGHFDNDTAADFAYTMDEAAENEREGIIRNTLLRVIDAECYLESPFAIETVAAPLL